MNAPAKTASTRVAPKLLSRRTLVQINRDQTASTPRIVWSHEIPILEAIFGEGTVLPKEPDSLDEGYSSKPSPDILIHNKKQDPIKPPSQTAGLDFVFIGDHRTEFDRLINLYGMHPEVKESYAEHVFGRFKDVDTGGAGAFSRLVGRPAVEDLPEPQLRSLVRDWGGTADQINAKATDLPAIATELGFELA